MHLDAGDQSGVGQGLGAAPGYGLIISGGDHLQEGPPGWILDQHNGVPKVSTRTDHHGVGSPVPEHPGPSTAEARRNNMLTANRT